MLSLFSEAKGLLRIIWISSRPTREAMGGHRNGEQRGECSACHPPHSTNTNKLLENCEIMWSQNCSITLQTSLNSSATRYAICPRNWTLHGCVTGQVDLLFIHMLLASFSSLALPSLLIQATKSRSPNQFPQKLELAPFAVPFSSNHVLGDFRGKLLVLHFEVPVPRS